MDLTLFGKNLEPQISSRGTKYALIEYDCMHGDGKVKLIIGDRDVPTSTPFGASTFNNEDASRKNIEFSITPSDEAKIDLIYNWAINCLTSTPEQYFKKNSFERRIV